MKYVSTAVLAAFLLLSVLGPLAAVAEDGSDASEQEFESASRRVEVDELEGELEVRSIGTDGDRIRMRLRGDEAELRFDFFTPETNSTEVQLQLTFESLWEYLDENGNGRFDSGERIVQDIRVDDMPFVGPSTEPFSGGTRIELEYSLADLDFQLVFWVFENETDLNGTLVRPTEVKFDITLRDFPFAREDSGLAVVMELKTEVEPRMSSNTTQETLQAVSVRFEGFFGWSRTAEVDGETVPVNSTVLKVETEVETGSEVEFEVERTVALAYPSGSLLVHDPVVGVTRVAEDTGLTGLGSTSYVIYGAAAAIGLATVILLLLRRRRQP